MRIDPQTGFVGTNSSSPKPSPNRIVMSKGKVVSVHTPGAFKPGKYPKPKPAPGLPKWFLDIRAGSDFMPAKVKPYSYNYMAAVESPNRQGLYAPGGSSVGTGMNVNLNFNTPTDDVAQGIKTSYNLRRDEENLGAEPVERKNGWFARTIDVISRPLYMMANMHKVNTELNYMTPESAGGERVTFGEHIQGILHDFTPLGPLQDIAKGQLDDRAAAAWRGLSGKDKTTSHTILKTEYPGFTKEHPKLALASAIGADLLFDPINWVSFGMTGPATVTKSIAAAGMRGVGRKEAAKKLLEETLLTSTGRGAAKEVLRNDAFQSQLRQLGRAANRAERRAVKTQKAATAGKAAQTEADKYRLAADLSAQAVKDAVITDMKGSEFAWRTLKSGAPLLGVGTVSRANVGASKWRRVSEGEALVKAAQASFLASAVTGTKDGEHWSLVHNIFRDSETGAYNDFTYKTPNGEQHTVEFSKIDPKLSEDDQYAEFMRLIYQEGAPLAKLAEGNTRAGRARKIRISATEARGQSFVTAFGNKIQSDIGNSLAKKVGKDFDKARTLKGSVEAHGLATEADLKNFATVKEDDLDNMTFDEMIAHAKEDWKKKQPKDNVKPWVKGNATLNVERADGSIKTVRINELRARAAQATRARSEDLLARAQADLRSASERAQDAAQGVSDPVARARAAMLEAHKRLTGAKANKTAELIKALGGDYASAVGKTEAATRVLDELHNLAPAEVKALYQKVTSTLNSDKYTDAEKAAFNKILNDKSLSMEERVTKVLGNMDVTDEEAGTIIREMAQLTMKDGELFASVVGEGSGPAMVSRIVNEVLKDRITSRVGKIDAKTAEEAGPLLRQAGYRVVTGKDGNIELVKAAKAPVEEVDKTANYARNLQGEIAMAVLDAYRYAIDYAVKSDMLNDPKVLFNTIHDSVDKFISNELAGMKQGVIQTMFSITGVRIPEDFVPKFADMARLFPDDGPPTFTWVNANGRKANQNIPWQNLANDMEKWATEVLVKDIGMKYDNIESLVAQVKAGGNLPVVHPEVAALIERTQVLFDPYTTSPRLLNDTTPVVNHYTPLDFMMHGEQILKSQDMTLHTTHVDNLQVNRVTTGRLSALDSFAYVDDGVRQGLQALSDLKKAMKSDDAEVAAAAKIAWVKMFDEAGGLEYVAQVKQQKFGEAFKSLGIHARLKEDVVSRGSKTLETKHRADLMDHMWSAQSATHEWQKAMHQRILFGTQVEGIAPEALAKQLGENINDFFKDYENIKKMIHPVKTKRGGGLRGLRDDEVNALGRAVQGNRQNKFDYKRNNPITEKAEFEFPHLADADKTRVLGEKVFKTGVEGKNRFFSKFLSDKPKLYAGTDDKKAALMKQHVLDNVSNVKVHGLKEGDKIHGIIIDVPPIRGASKGSRYLVTGKDSGQPLDTWFSLPSGGTPESAFRKVTRREKGVEPRESVVTPMEANIPGASVSGNVNVVEPAREYAEGTTGAQRTSALSGTTQEQRARVAELLSQLDEVNASRNAEVAALKKYGEAQNNPASLNVRAPVEEAAFSHARQVYVNEMKGLENNPFDEADFSNVSEDLLSYSTPEMDRIRAWIAKTYADNPPEALAKQMHALSNAMTEDILRTQGQIQHYFSDFNLNYGASMKFFGVPLMNTPHAMNATHTEAGVTALAQSQSRARRALTSRMDPSMNQGKWNQLSINLRRRTHVLNAELDNIASTYANNASQSRRVIIRALNGLYRTINKGEYLDPGVGALSRKARFQRINRQLFDPATQHTGNNTKMFDQVETYADGSHYNPVDEIVNGLHEVSFRYFTDADGNLETPLELGRKLRAFNKFMVKEYRIGENEINAVIEAVARKEPISKMVPYTVEWLNEFAKITTPSSRLSRERLLNINLGQFHYAMHDTKLKLDAGDALHNGVWAEFAFMKRFDDAKFYNEKVQPQTIGADGKAMRGKWVNIKDIEDSLTYGIGKEYIPGKYKTGEYYISEDLLPEIKVLFEYMDKTHELNDTINIGFFNKVMNYFKSSVTIYNIPGYPIRNLMSDVFLGAMDGLVNPRYYGDAAKLLYNHRKSMKEMDLKSYQGIIDDNFMKRSYAEAIHDPASVMNPAVNPNKPVVLRLSGVGGRIELNEDQVMHLYEQLGLGQNRVSGDIPEATAAARRTNTSAAGGALSDKIRDLNDIREDWGRLSHFLYALENEAPLGGGIDQIARRAGDRVMKHHFDYSDVSLFERQRIAPYIPFYKWTKNIIPYTLANVVMRPKFLNIERAATATVGNIINDDPNDTKEDFIVADWIRDDLPVPIGSWTDPNGYKFQQFASMYLPLSQTITDTLAPTGDALVDSNTGLGGRFLNAGTGVASTVAAMSNPLVKSAYQAVSGEIPWASGSAPEGNENWFKSLGAIIPGQPMVKNITKTGSSYFKDGTEGKNEMAQLMNMLGALRLYNNNESAQKGQLKIMEDLQRGNINKAKAQLVQDIVKKYPNASEANAKIVVDEFIMKNLRSNDAARL